MKVLHLCTILVPWSFIATKIVKGYDASAWEAHCPNEWDSMTNCFNETVPSVVDTCLSCITSTAEPDILIPGTCSDFSQRVCNGTGTLCKSECGACHNEMVDVYYCNLNHDLQNIMSEFADCYPVLNCNTSSSGSSAPLSGHVRLLLAFFFGSSVIIL